MRLHERGHPDPVRHRPGRPPCPEAPVSQTSLESIFFAALERPPSERGAYLDAACGGDAGLRACVEKMLAAQPDLGEFLDRPHPAPAEALRASGAFQPPADHCG